jgi:hypothetical protein
VIGKNDRLVSGKQGIGVALRDRARTALGCSVIKSTTLTTHLKLRHLAAQELAAASVSIVDQHDVRLSASSLLAKRQRHYCSASSFASTPVNLASSAFGASFAGRANDGNGARRIRRAREIEGKTAIALGALMVRGALRLGLVKSDPLPALAYKTR